MSTSGVNNQVVLSTNPAVSADQKGVSSYPLHSFPVGGLTFFAVLPLYFIRLGYR